MSPAHHQRRRLILAATALTAAATFVAASMLTPTINGAQLGAAITAIWAVLILTNDHTTEERTA